MYISKFKPTLPLQSRAFIFRIKYKLTRNSLYSARAEVFNIQCALYHFATILDQHLL